MYDTQHNTHTQRCSPSPLSSSPSPSLSLSPCQGERGTIRTSTYLQTYKVGQLVDIVGNGAVQKGMPHKFYHGKTGLVWNVTPRAVGVQVNKRVGNRILPKRLHVRIEHVKHSSSRKDFLERVIRNEKIKQDNKQSGSQTAADTGTDQQPSSRQQR